MVIEKNLSVLKAGEAIMKKSKVSKSTKSKKTVRSSGLIAENDFIIIVGGGLVVLMLTVFLFLQ